MRKILVLVAVMLLVAAGCAKDASVASIEWDWSIQVSPLTGNCYEVFSHSLGKRAGVLAMAPIECP